MMTSSKKFRSELAHKMRDEREKKNNQLSQLENLPISEQVKDQARNEIISNFYRDIKTMQSTPEYLEAKKTHLEEIKSKHNQKNSKSVDMKDKLSEKFNGDIEMIVDDLVNKHVSIENNVDFLGEKGKKISVELPAVGDFKGYKFEAFISDSYKHQSEFFSNEQFINQSYSIKELSELMSALNSYLGQCGAPVELINYENDLQVKKGITTKLDVPSSDVCYCLSRILFGEDYHHGQITDAYYTKESRKVRFDLDGPGKKGIFTDIPHGFSRLLLKPYFKI